MSERLLLFESASIDTKNVTSVHYSLIIEGLFVSKSFLSKKELLILAKIMRRTLFSWVVLFVTFVFIIIVSMIGSKEMTDNVLKSVETHRENGFNSGCWGLFRS